MKEHGHVTKITVGVGLTHAKRRIPERDITKFTVAVIMEFKGSGVQCHRGTGFVVVGSGTTERIVEEPILTFTLASATSLNDAENDAAFVRNTFQQASAYFEFNGKGYTV